MRIWDKILKRHKPLTQEELEDIVEEKIIKILQIGNGWKN